MPDSPRTPRRFDRLGWVAAFAVPAVVAAGVVVLLAEWRAGNARVAAVGPPVKLVDYPPVHLPPVIPAAAADLPDGAAVIGVSEGGRHRAYVIDALAPIDRHVLNDVLAGRPVTVSYCDRTDRAEVFVGDGDRPLDVAVGGWVGGGAGGCMLLRVGAAQYRQDTGAAVGEAGAGRFPHPRREFVRTTWGKWRAAHPDTDVHTGAGDRS